MTESKYVPSKSQKRIAVCVLVLLVIEFILNANNVVISAMQQGAFWAYVLHAVRMVAWIFVWWLLMKLTSNRVSRIAAMLMMIGICLPYVVTIAGEWFCYAWNSRHYTYPPHWVGIVRKVAHIACNVVCVYALSLILLNNHIADKTWIHIIVIEYIFYLCGNICNPMWIDFLHFSLNEKGANFLVSSAWYLIDVLSIFAFFMLCRSEVFAQQADEVPSNFSPLNKYVLAMAVVLALGVVAAKTIPSFYQTSQYDPRFDESGNYMYD